MRITRALECRCKEQHKLAGIVYLKDISHIRMTGSACRNLRPFRKLCGDSSLRNVVILTKMWSRVSEEEGLARQSKLQDGDSYFKPMIDNGATIFCHDNTRESANRVVEHFFMRAPTTLQIQKEIVHEKRDLIETEAGKELREQLDTRTTEVSDEVAALEEEIAGEQDLLPICVCRLWLTLHYRS